MELAEKCKLVNHLEKKLIEAEITIENLKQNIDPSPPQSFILESKIQQPTEIK